MGNDASKQAADVRYLIERVPFEEAEVDRLLLLLRYAHDDENENSSNSILSQWSKHVQKNVVTASPETRQEVVVKDYLLLLDQVERDILPPEFGAKLGSLLKLPATTKNHCKELETLDDWSRREKLETYLEALANCCGRRGSRAALGTLFQLCALPDNAAVQNSKDLTDVDGHEVKAPVAAVLDLAYRLALAVAILRGDMNVHVVQKRFSKLDDSLVSSCISFVGEQRLRRSVDVSVDIDDIDLEQGCCSKMDFIEWTEATIPMLASILPSFQHLIYFPDQVPPLTVQTFQFPTLSDPSSFWDDHILAPVLFSFGCMTKSLGGEWHQLYTSCSDGLSYNGLQNALRGYSGPTLLLIRASDSGSVFGALTASPWKESKDYYGTDDCFLYQISPELTVCRPSGRSRNYMFCRSSSQTQMGGGGQAPQGIGFGGNSNRSPRLFLDESFSGCFVSSHDTTFEAGHLLPRTDGFSQKCFFSADQIEVWGCGGGDIVAAALSAQRQDRSLRESYLNQARKVDKAAFLSDFRTGLIQSKAFGHMDDIHGSTHKVLLDRTQGKEGYC